MITVDWWYTNHGLPYLFVMIILLQIQLWITRKGAKILLLSSDRLYNIIKTVARYVSRMNTGLKFGLGSLFDGKIITLKLDSYLSNYTCVKLDVPCPTKLMICLDYPTDCCTKLTWLWNEMVNIFLIDGVNGWKDTFWATHEKRIICILCWWHS